MIEALKKKLSEEVEKLQYELNVVLPQEIRKAVELGDLRENSEYKAALEFEEGHVTMASPIGRALLGKGVGDVAYLKLPTMVRHLRVVELKTIHDMSADEV